MLKSKCIVAYTFSSDTKISDSNASYSFQARTTKLGTNLWVCLTHVAVSFLTDPTREIPVADFQIGQYSHRLALTNGNIFHANSL